MGVNDTAAVVLYDEISSGFRAKDVCDRIRHQLADNSNLRVDLWRTDVLAQSPSALQQARAADMLVLALRPDTVLSKPIRAWMETWAKSRRVEDAALVFLPAESEAFLSPVVSFELQKFAQNNKLSFFSEKDAPDHSMLHAFPTPDPSGSFSHWGLND
jgi:hypothetical protein